MSVSIDRDFYRIVCIQVPDGENYFEGYAKKCTCGGVGGGGSGEGGEGENVCVCEPELDDSGNETGDIFFNTRSFIGEFSEYLDSERLINFPIIEGFEEDDRGKHKGKKILRWKMVDKDVSVLKKPNVSVKRIASPSLPLPLQPLPSTLTTIGNGCGGGSDIKICSEVFVPKQQREWDNNLVFTGASGVMVPESFSNRDVELRELYGTTSRLMKWLEKKDIEINSI